MVQYFSLFLKICFICQFARFATVLFLMNYAHHIKKTKKKIAKGYI